MQHRQTWRGEVCLEAKGSEPRSLLVRADPVYASPDRVLGFVIIFTENGEQKAASAARQQLQQGLIERYRVVTGRIGSNNNLDYRSLISSAVENAQLAALEITDRADVERMVEMLESVSVSVARTTELLEHLIWHAARAREK